MEYLALVDYFIGLEVLRLALVLLLVLRTKGTTLKQKLTQTFLRWLPFAAAPGGFLLWRLFFFETDRRATDIGFQLGQLFSSPLVGLWWLVYLVQDVFNVLLVAWGYPLYTIAYQMRLRDTLIGFGLAAFVVLLVVIGLRWGRDDTSETEAASSSGWMREEYWLGLVTIFGNLVAGHPGESSHCLPRPFALRFGRFCGRRDFADRHYQSGRFTSAASNTGGFPGRCFGIDALCQCCARS